jgi:hypothetical protein
MTNEQFSQVVEAILAGKYSWACLLILRFSGYNPLHYIPYRTYNRLMKDNSRLQTSHQKDGKDAKGMLNQQPSRDLFLEDCSNKIRDLTYLESLQEQSAKVHGGSLAPWEILSVNRAIFSLPIWFK